MQATEATTEVGTKHSTYELRYHKCLLKMKFSMFNESLERKKENAHYMSQELTQRSWHDPTHLSSLKCKLYYTRLCK